MACNQSAKAGEHSREKKEKGGTKEKKRINVFYHQTMYSLHTKLHLYDSEPVTINDRTSNMYTQRRNTVCGLNQCCRVEKLARPVIRTNLGVIPFLLTDVLKFVIKGKTV